VHYDIKHENVLIHFPDEEIESKKDLKEVYKKWKFTQKADIGLCDYGFAIKSKKSKKIKSKSLFGTSGLIPPESEKAGKNVSTYPHDIYSYGATLYRMLTFEIPFEENDK